MACVGVTWYGPAPNVIFPDQCVLHNIHAPHCWTLHNLVFISEGVRGVYMYIRRELQINIEGLCGLYVVKTRDNHLERKSHQLAYDSQPIIDPGNTWMWVLQAAPYNAFSIMILRCTSNQRFQRSPLSRHCSMFNTTTYFGTTWSVYRVLLRIFPFFSSSKHSPTNNQGKRTTEMTLDNKTKGSRGDVPCLCAGGVLMPYFNLSTAVEAPAATLARVR